MKSFLSKLFGAQAIANIVGTAVMVSCIFAYIYYINPPMPQGTINQPYYSSDIEEMVTVETGIDLTMIDIGYYIPTSTYQGLVQCEIKVVDVDEATRSVYMESSWLCNPDEILIVHVSDQGDWKLMYKFQRYEIVYK